MKSVIIFSLLGFLINPSVIGFTEETKLIHFDRNSCSLSDSNKVVLDDFYKIFSQHTKFENGQYVKVFVFTCEKEIKNNRFIGLMRVREVIDYYIDEYGMSRDNFLIQEYSIDSQKVRPCSASGIGVGVMF